jgi:hypothetical protein
MSKITDQEAVQDTILSCTHWTHIDGAEQMIVAFQVKWELDDFCEELNSLHSLLQNHSEENIIQ